MQAFLSHMNFSTYKFSRRSHENHHSESLHHSFLFLRRMNQRRMNELLQLVFILIAFASSESLSSSSSFSSRKLLADEAPPVKLIQGDQQVTVDNGLFSATFSVPEGMINEIKYNGISNLLSENNDLNNRMYFDAVWGQPPGFSILHKIDVSDTRIDATKYNVTVQTDEQVELSFTYTWDAKNSSKFPVNVEKRYVVLRALSGIYIYAIYERLEGWPDMDFTQTRIVFKPNGDKFTYMAMTDERQRVMPTAEDRLNGQTLDYKEAVKLSTNTSNPDLIGEVDDKYQYSAQYKNSRVHGWISDDPAVGLWMITPSNEFKNGGPTRQRMHSHTGPTMLNVLSCGHYAGPDLGIQFRNGEPWKKVFGPVLVYLNSGDRASAWLDAKKQMLAEVGKWPYDFPASVDHLKSSQRGVVSGQLQVLDRFAQKGSVAASKAQVGLAAPGEAGSWQRESKGYQFWVAADETGNFAIKNVRPGTYSLYAFVPGFIGDYVYNATVVVAPGGVINLGVLTYEPPRDGPTLWEIGIPDRTAAEYFIPDPDKDLRNYLYDKLRDQKFRQYGLWRRYTELYPDEDLTFTINQNNYTTDWFFAHVTRKAGDNQFVPTTWKINYALKNVTAAAVYKLRIALASANAAELQVRVNGEIADPPLFKTDQIGKENAIARHGVQGLYWLFDIDVPGEKLVAGNNKIFLTQSVATGPFHGVMYDYIRLEGPAV